MAQTLKRLSTMWETWVPSLGGEDPLEKEMAIHSSTIAWKILWTEEPGRLHSPWGRKESDTTGRLHFPFTLKREDFVLLVQFLVESDLLKFYFRKMFRQQHLRWVKE